MSSSSMFSIMATLAATESELPNEWKVTLDHRVIAYFAGYSCHKLLVRFKCEECRKNTVRKELSVVNNDIILNLISEKCNYVYHRMPSKNLIDFVHNALEQYHKHSINIWHEWHIGTKLIEKNEQTYYLRL